MKDMDWEESSPLEKDVAHLPLNGARGKDSIYRQPSPEAATLSIFRYMSIPAGQSVIRILHLRPGQSGTRLEGSLHHAVLNSEPDYEAISYAWGSHEKTCKLYLDDTCYLPITPSLHAALLRLRLPRQTRRLWIDAVSIDQADLQERAQQVQLMNYIYKTASRVVCWLGESDDDAEDALGLLRIISQSNMRSARTSGLNDDLMQSRKLPPKGDPMWILLVRFFNRSWFQRCWVVQEFLVGRHVKLTCGACTVDWRDIDNGVRKLNELTLLRWAVSYSGSMRRELPIAERAGQEFRTLMTMRKNTNVNDFCYDVVNRLVVGDVDLPDLEAELATGQNVVLRFFLTVFKDSIGREAQRTSHLRRLLEAFRNGQFSHLKPFDSRDVRFPFVPLAFHMRHRQASDPRDKLFGLLGISIEGGDAVLRPSYTEPVALSYTRFARHLITLAVDSKPLFLLVEAGLHSRPPWSTLALPSWVYDWSHRPVWELNPLPAEGASSNLFHAAGRTKPVVLSPASMGLSDELRLVGGFVDTVGRTVTFPDWRGERNAKGEQVWGLTEDGKIDMSSPEAFDSFIKYAKGDMVNMDPAADIKQFFASVDALVFCRNDDAATTVAPLCKRAEESPEEVLWRTLIANMGATPQKILAAADPAVGLQYQHFRRWAAALTVPSPNSQAVIEDFFSSAATHWSRMFFNLSQFYSLCDTQTGFLALVPRCAEEGDKIYILNGTELPLVLRRVQSGDSEKMEDDGEKFRFRLVGCCYVHGIMQGEFLDGPEWEEKEIVLC